MDTNVLRQEVLKKLHEMHPNYNYESSTNILRSKYLDDNDMMQLQEWIMTKYNADIIGTNPKNFETIDAIVAFIQDNIG